MPGFDSLWERIPRLVKKLPLLATYKIVVGRPTCVSRVVLPGGSDGLPNHVAVAAGLGYGMAL
jgi:hypothetical protein